MFMLIAIEYLTYISRVPDYPNLHMLREMASRWIARWGRISQLSGWHCINSHSNTQLLGMARLSCSRSSGVMVAHMP
jgi:hypothetical protein